jgi:hypothetical protein
MFWINMMTHDNCAMFFVIHNQAFLALGKTLTYFFLLHILVENA